MKTAAKTTGLRYWMLRVLDECDKAAAEFSADPVHDLRVALRRCRSMADGLMALDPDPEWKAMKRAGKQLFQSLGALRDVQIMMEWIERLRPHADGDVSNSTAKHWPDFAPQVRPKPADLQQRHPSESQAVPLTSAEATAGQGTHDPVAEALLNVLLAREHEHKREARTALGKFDRKQWRQWSRSLPARAARFRLGSTLFKHLALERWTAARALHTRALRNRSQSALHEVRIGIKRFRYLVENFLPQQHQAWSDDLKYVQDVLGEVHDLDVLWATALSCHVFPDDAAHRRWLALIREERQKRIESYRQRTTGPDNLWMVWRSALPSPEKLKDIATRRMKLWASSLDPDFAHSERVSRLAVELYDGLQAGRLLGSSDGVEGRFSLRIAALLHDVGKAKGNKGHHKTSFRLLKKHGVPLGWEAGYMRHAAIVARFHCGALPTKSHKILRDLLPAERKRAIQLAAILRLANAFDAAHDGRTRHVRIENFAGKRNGKRLINGLPSKPILAPNQALVVAAEGYSPKTFTARAIAAERHLLETVLRRPVLVTAMKTSPAYRSRF